MTDIDTGAGALRLSCSFGVALGAPGDDIDALLRKADAALYAAKRAGRNRVAFYDAEIALCKRRRPASSEPPEPPLLPGDGSLFARQDAARVQRSSWICSNMS